MALHHGDRIDEMRKDAVSTRCYIAFGDVKKSVQMFLDFFSGVWACGFLRPVVGKGARDETNSRPRRFWRVEVNGGIGWS